MSASASWICGTSQHNCGQMNFGGAFEPRCRVYGRALDEIAATHSDVDYPSWWDVLGLDRHTLAGARDPPPRSYARPRNLIRNGIIVDVNMDPSFPITSYIAVSYTWSPSPTFVPWHGRRVTTQALDIAARLAQRTSLALWIDAICIDQDDDSVKEEELPKMADIYRGAAVVLCLVDDVGPQTCAVVRLWAQLGRHAACDALRAADDIYGLYMFATAGESDAVRTMFGHRWWERAWTFQEAVVNRQTYLVGASDATIPMADVLSIALIIRRTAASTVGAYTPTLGRPSAFWDSVAAMAVAAERPLTLGESMACVWRRNAGVRHDLVYAMFGVCGLAHAVRPSYKAAYEAVLCGLFDAAASLGDYSWIPWCSTIDHSTTQAGLGFVPFPEHIRDCPFMDLTHWRSTTTPPSPPHPEQNSNGSRHATGVRLPLRSAGVVRPRQARPPAPLTLEETVARLRELGHADDAVWDALFGLSVGMMADTEASVGAPGIAAAALRCALLMIRGEQSMEGAATDMAGVLPHTQGITFMNYSLMAAREWLRRGHRGGQLPAQRRLSIVSCQAGDAVIPYAFESGAGVTLEDRLYILPVELSIHGGRNIAVIAGGAPAARTRAVALLLRKPHSGSGKWQTRVVQ